MIVLIGQQDTTKLFFRPKQLILLESISCDWISLKCDNWKRNEKIIREKKGRRGKIRSRRKERNEKVSSLHKMSSLQNLHTWTYQKTLRLQVPENIMQ